jgi:hypothetical protein
LQRPIKKPTLKIGRFRNSLLKGSATNKWKSPATNKIPSDQRILNQMYLSVEKEQKRPVNQAGFAVCSPEGGDLAAERPNPFPDQCILVKMRSNVLTSPCSFFWTVRVYVNIIAQNKTKYILFILN